VDMMHARDRVGRDASADARDRGSTRSSSARSSKTLKASPSESEVGDRAREDDDGGGGGDGPQGSDGGSKSPSENESEASGKSRNVSVKDLVTNLKAQARRHDSRTSPYRGVSLLRQTGKYHAQINVQRKQIHLGFFFSEEEAARAYDRAAIFKASVEGGVICTNMDINEYRDEIPALQSMTQPELLQMLHAMKLKSNEKQAPPSPRKMPKAPARTSTNAKMERKAGVVLPPPPPAMKIEKRSSGSSPSSSTQDVGSPRFDALSTAVSKFSDDSIDFHPCPVPAVVDLHLSKRRRTRIQPQQAPAMA
jgi:hypothetical protein